MEYIKSSANAFSNYYKCESLFNEFKQDKELLKKGFLLFQLKMIKKEIKLLKNKLN